MNEDYRPLSEIKKEIEENFPAYWAKIFNILDDVTVTPTGVRVKKDNKEDIKRLRKELANWEKEIQKYSQELSKSFDLSLFDEQDIEAYDPQEFKDDIFANDLWTVSSALRTQDPDLEMYKGNFYATTAKDIFIVVKNILKAADAYMKNVAPSIKFNQIKTIEQLKLDFLAEEGMLLTGVIGLGIRSEMLHRLYPSHFPIMTRRSLWGMYYLTDESDEFVVDEENHEGQQRTSSNWEYDYERFAYYNNFLCNLIESSLQKSGLKIKPNLRFGYVNEFLSAIFNEHKKQIKFLSTWR